MDVKVKKQKLGKNMKVIVDALSQGKVLNRIFEGGFPVFVIEGIGEVKRNSVERLIASGRLKENSDGMFGVGQSFSLVEGV